MAKPRSKTKTTKTEAPRKLKSEELDTASAGATAILSDRTEGAARSRSTTSPATPPGVPIPYPNTGKKTE